MPHTLLPIAREAQYLARNAGAGESVLFQKVAAVSMFTVAVASGILQAAGDDGAQVVELRLARRLVADVLISQ